MKKNISLFIMMLWFTAMASAQAIHVFHDNMAKADVYLNAEVDSIKFNSSSDCGEYDGYLLYTTTGLVKYDVAKVDSIKFNMPYLKLLPRKGKCKIPHDDLIIVANYAYSHSGQSPVLRLPDGKEIQGGVADVLDENTKLYAFSSYASELYESRNGSSEETWYFVDGENVDSLNVEFTGRSMFENQWHEVGISPDAMEFKLKPLLDNIRLGGINYGDEHTTEYNWANWEYDENGDILIKFTKNETSEKREINITPHTDYLECPWGGTFVQLPEFKHTADDHMQALKDLYQSAGIKDLNTNWFSDEPLWKWKIPGNNGIFSINSDKWSNFYWHINDHVTYFSTGGGQYTGMTGTLPPSFEVFMDDAYGNGGLDLGQCAFYGKIPQNIKNHQQWNKIGWDIIPQMIWCGGGFDLEGHSNLYLDDSEVEDFIIGQTSTVYEVLSKNKLTWVFNGGAVDMINGISDERVNKYLDYKDKGFGLVVTVGGYWDVPYDDYQEYVLNEREYNGLPDDILWTKGFDKATIGSYGSMSLVDSKGELIWYREGDSGMPDSYYLNQIDEVCRQYFGEPSDHPIYESHLYESTDFSQDGEVMLLQQAVVGNGIQLVLTGDKFVDKDFEEGGIFECQMNEAMEQFFSVEPYASLRDRFTVYAVKAVSVNDYRGSNHAFNNDDMKVMEYVNKIPGIDLDNVTVAVIEYDPNFQFFVSGYTTWYENGASIAYLQNGNASDVIVHEAGGHGFAKLLDEYIYPGAENNKLYGDELVEFKEYIEDYYHAREWGMNVSTTDNTDEVPWRAFMNDSRYENEIGIYQGAWYYPYDLWRPSENSIMKETEFHEFNAPSREAIYKRVMRLSEGEDWTYDYETFVAFDQQILRKGNNRRRIFESANRPMIHKTPKLRRIVDGRIEDVPTPSCLREKEEIITFPSVNSVENRSAKSGGPSRMPVQQNSREKKSERDRVIVRCGQVLSVPVR